MSKELLLIEIREDGARVVKRNIDDIGASADSAQDAAKQLKSVLGGLVTTKVIKDVALLADNYANLLNRLRVVTDGQYALEKAMEGVFKISRETRSSLEANVDMYARVALNTTKLGLSMQDVLNFSKQLNHAIILSGVTAREAQWGMIQFSQALASGTLRGDELRATMEQLPMVTRVISDHLGVTRGELRKLAFEGKITSQILIEAFDAASSQLEEMFMKRVPTLDQAFTVLRSSLIKFIGTLDQASQGTSGLARVLLVVADNMDIIGRLVAILGTVLGTILLTNTIQIVAQWKLFSLTLLRTHVALMLFIAASSALVVYADRIKVASESTATLSDVFRAMQESAGRGFKTIEEHVREVVTVLGGVIPETQGVIQYLVIAVAYGMDSVLGVVVGVGAAIGHVITNIPTYFKKAWNGALSIVESMLDSIRAMAKTVVDMLKNLGLRVKVFATAMGNAIKEALTGSLERAKQFAEQAAMAFKNINIGAEFGATLNKNLQEAASADSLSGLRAEIDNTGKTMGEAFMEGMESVQIDKIDKVVTGWFDRAAEIAAEREFGAAALGEGGSANVPDPLADVKKSLLKDMRGDAKALAQQMQALNKLYADGVITLGEYNNKWFELQANAKVAADDIAGGFAQGFAKVGEEISNFSEMASQTVVNAFHSMEDALVDFVTTGQVDFKALVDSMLADLTRLLARQMMMAALSALFPGAGGLFGAAAGAAGGTARAGGGPISPGQPYTINDDSPGGRPETIVFGQQGRVMNSRETAMAGAGGRDETPIQLINVWSEGSVTDIMSGSSGRRVLVNQSNRKKRW